MKSTLLSLPVLLTTCKGSTAPTAPNGLVTVSVTNQTTQDTVWFTWASSNVVGGVVGPVLSGQSSCVHFHALPDSAYFAVGARGPENVYTSWPIVPFPHFDPAKHPDWTVIVPDSVSPIAGAIVMVIREVSSAPC